VEADKGPPLNGRSDRGARERGVMDVYRGHPVPRPVREGESEAPCDQRVSRARAWVSMNEPRKRGGTAELYRYITLQGEQIATGTSAARFFRAFTQFLGAACGTQYFLLHWGAILNVYFVSLVSNTRLCTRLHSCKSASNTHGLPGRAPRRLQLVAAASARLG
jgi:hypothetical protein